MMMDERAAQAFFWLSRVAATQVSSCLLRWGLEMSEFQRQAGYTDRWRDPYRRRGNAALSCFTSRDSLQSTVCGLVVWTQLHLCKSLADTVKSASEVYRCFEKSRRVLLVACCGKESVKSK